MPRSSSHSTSRPGGVISSCWRIRTGFTPTPGGYVDRTRSSPAFLRHHSLGLVLRDGQCDVQGVGRGLWLYAGASKVHVPLLDGVAEASDALDLHLDYVAWLHRPGVGRGSGKDYVAGLERDQPAQISKLVGDGEDQVVRAALLNDLAVEVGPEGEIFRVELLSRHKLGPEGQKPVLPLDPQHRTPVRMPEIVQPDIVGARVAGDVREHLLHRHPLHATPDHGG